MTNRFYKKNSNKNQYTIFPYIQTSFMKPILLLFYSNYKDVSYVRANIYTIVESSTIGAIQHFLYVSTIIHF